MLRCTRLRWPCQATGGRRAPQNPHPSPEVPPPLSPSQFPGPPYAADGCWVRGVSVGAVLATQHRRSAAALAIPAMAFPPGLGAQRGADGAEPLHATPAPRTGSGACAKGRGRRPAGLGDWKGSLVGPRHRARRCQVLSLPSPLFLPPFGIWQRSRGGGWGVQCRGRAAKPRQPPAAPWPPVPRLVAGRRAACAWQGSVSCGRIPVPRSLPISLRAGTAGGSGGTGREGWGGRIVKGRKGGKKKKIMDTCHRWSGKAAKTPAGSGGQNPPAAERRVWQRVPAWAHGGRAAWRRHGVAEAGRAAAAGAGEDRGLRPIGAAPAWPWMSLCHPSLLWDNPGAVAHVM
ncbi:uncharacterized protein LOC128793368 [Vidua chalybeata]|uniref:uncharacterized protein LOC128793368 n=1 Tax=Vidua chalybeata TaxID=81927 RepID=UPI0023A8E4E1|nr:uncharacterized protein LOC128793368 [Vidua chalybeata]